MSIRNPPFAQKGYTDPVAQQIIQDVVSQSQDLVDRLKQIARWTEIDGRRTFAFAGQLVPELLQRVLIESYSSPTWVLAVVDMTPLEEPAFDEALWNGEKKYACAYPRDENLIVVNINLRDKAPDVVEFLGDFGVSQDQINEALLYMKDNGVEGPEAALWFLRNYEATWTEWVSSDIANKVKEALAAM